jgi:acyl carrier protein
VIGNPGQANYVAANAVLESLAARRLGEGRAAQIVALAPIADVGKVAGDVDLASSFDRIGVRPLSSAEVFAQMDAIVLNGGPGFLIGDVKWDRLQGAIAALKGAKFRSLTKNASHRHSSAASDDFALLATTLSPEELFVIVLDEVTHLISQVLYTSADKLDPESALFDMGMDSLMGMELRMLIEERFGVEVSRMSLGQDASARRVAETISAQLLGRQPVSQPISPTVDTSSVQSQGSHILARHAEEVDPEMITDALSELGSAKFARLIS